MPNENLTRGLPYRSKYAEHIPAAVAMRKATGASWREIAKRLAVEKGINIPFTSLQKVARTWINRQEEMDRLPTLGVANMTPPPVQVPQPGPQVQMNRETNPSPVPVEPEDYNDFNVDTGLKIKINRKKPKP